MQGSEVGEAPYLRGDPLDAVAQEAEGLQFRQAAWNGTGAGYECWIHDSRLSFTN